MPLRNDFTILKSRRHLLRVLGIEDAVLEEVLAFDPDARVSGDDVPVFQYPLFFRHDIPKKNWKRGYRTVWEPLSLKNEYKALARRLADFFAHKLDSFPHPRSFGYVGGRNIRENAQDHCGRRFLLTVDLQDFFPSISTPRIAGLLKNMGVDQAVADLLARFMTIGGGLPLGLPTSPIVANAICLALDVDLAALGQRHDAIFSRYADDISFSGNAALPPLEEIRELVQRHGFELAEEKTRFSKTGQAHYVTGLSISDPAQPHVPRVRKRRLRQELYFARKYGLDDHFRHQSIYDGHLVQGEVNRLDGLVKFTAFHEPRLSASLKTDWAEILRTSGHSPSFEPKNQGREPFSIYVDEAEFHPHPDGVRRLALGMAVSQHQARVSRAAQDVLDDALADMHAAGDREAIAKRGLHFTDAHPDLRFAYIERMNSLPFEGYVAMAKLSGSAEYESTYIRLLNAMIKRRLMAAESKFAHFIFEKNDKVSQEAIRGAVMAAHQALAKENNRRPQQCFVDFAGKPEPGMSAPDFLLGVLGGYLRSEPVPEGRPASRDRLLFERIRDKYRLILDIDDWTEYSRRQEIAPWKAD